MKERKQMLMSYRNAPARSATKQPPAQQSPVGESLQQSARYPQEAVRPSEPPKNPIHGPNNEFGMVGRNDDGLKTELTEGKLSALQREEFRDTDDDALKSPQFNSQNKESLSKPPRKKAALGFGDSPSSSVRTSYSQSDSPKRSRDDSVGVSQIASPIPSVSKAAPASTLRYSNDKDFQPRARGAAGVLYDFDSPSGNQARPSHLKRGRKSQPPSQPTNQQTHNQPQPQSAPLSPTAGLARGTFPSSVLNTTAPPFPRDPFGDGEPPRIILQPVTRPISQEQLIAEVKGIYAGLVMVEGKCIQVDLKQAQLAKDAPPGQPPKLNNDQWQALIALHRTLLHEHHDFFLASQHPSATAAVRRLATKYAMPARLWKHGIHAFLELLRNRLPDCLDHMLAFIYLAYSMMTLLYETVPSFKETWIECLGDLGRYRMAIEDDDVRDREVWTQVARQWYVKASNMSPTTGRLYHHLAILARPNAMQQLYYYGKALSVAQPFVAAKESILTLFDPILGSKQSYRKFSVIVTAYVKCHAILFTRTQMDIFDATRKEFTSLLNDHIEKAGKRFQEQGYYLAISNAQALLGWGSSNNVVMRALLNCKEEKIDVEMTGVTGIEKPTDVAVFKMAHHLFIQTANVVFQAVDDLSRLSFVHCTLAFLDHIASVGSAINLVEQGFPWQPLIGILNNLIRNYKTYDRIESKDIPVPDKEDFRPFPDDFALRGLFWTEHLYPRTWFENRNIDDENQYKDEASVDAEFRPERILWLAINLVGRVQGLAYNYTEHLFFMPGQKANPLAAKVEDDSEIDSVTVGDRDDVSMASRATTCDTENTQNHSVFIADKMETDTV
jgi:hypothetical protein